MAQPTFERLGFAFAVNPWSRGYGISMGGGFVVGVVGGIEAGHIRAFCWSRAGGMALLAVPQEPPLDFAMGISDDGAVAVGSSVPLPVVWVNGKPTVLPTIPNAPLPDGGATDLSEDGRTIVGVVWPTRSSSVAVRWRNGKLEDLSILPGDATAITAMAIGEDGDPPTIVGAGQSSGVRAVRIANGWVHDLGDIPGAGRGVEQDASDISDDGWRIVGRGSSATSAYGEAYLWSAPTGMVGLGTIPALVRLSSSRAISGDGRVVGGLTGADQLYVYRGFIWDPVRGMRHLDAVLDAHGVDRRGWSIEEVNAISRDGTAMTGTALNAARTRGEAFLVTLPPWCWADCTGDDMVDFDDLLCFLNRFERAQDPRANPIDFFYCDLAPDDEIDFNDFLAFLNLYNKGC